MQFPDNPEQPAAKPSTAIMLNRLPYEGNKRVTSRSSFIVTLDITNDAGFERVIAMLSDSFLHESSPTVYDGFRCKMRDEPVPYQDIPGECRKYDLKTGGIRLFFWSDYENTTPCMINCNLFTKDDPVILNSCFLMFPLVDTSGRTGGFDCSGQWYLHYAEAGIPIVSGKEIQRLLQLQVTGPSRINRRQYAIDIVRTASAPVVIQQNVDEKIETVEAAQVYYMKSHDFAEMAGGVGKGHHVEGQFVKYETEDDGDAGGKESVEEKQYNLELNDFIEYNKDAPRFNDVDEDEVQEILANEFDGMTPEQRSSYKEPEGSDSFLPTDESVKVMDAAAMAAEAAEKRRKLTAEQPASPGQSETSLGSLVNRMEDHAIDTDGSQPDPAAQSYDNPTEVEIKAADLTQLLSWCAEYELSDKGQKGKKREKVLRERIIDHLFEPLSETETEGGEAGSDSDIECNDLCDRTIPKIPTRITAENFDSDIMKMDREQLIEEMAMRKLEYQDETADMQIALIIYYKQMFGEDSSCDEEGGEAGSDDEGIATPARSGGKKEKSLRKCGVLKRPRGTSTSEDSGAGADLTPEAQLKLEIQILKYAAESVFAKTAGQKDKTTQVDSVNIQAVLEQHPELRASAKRLFELCAEAERVPKAEKVFDPTKFAFGRKDIATDMHKFLLREGQKYSGSGDTEESLTAHVKVQPLVHDFDTSIDLATASQEDILRKAKRSVEIIRTSENRIRDHVFFLGRVLISAIASGSTADLYTFATEIGINSLHVFKYIRYAVICSCFPLLLFYEDGWRNVAAAAWDLLRLFVKSYSKEHQEYVGMEIEICQTAKPPEITTAGFLNPPLEPLSFQHSMVLFANCCGTKALPGDAPKMYQDYIDSLGAEDQMKVFETFAPGVRPKKKSKKDDDKSEKEEALLQEAYRQILTPDTGLEDDGAMSTQESDAAQRRLDYYTRGADGEHPGADTVVPETVVWHNHKKEAREFPKNWDLECLLRVRSEIDDSMIEFPVEFNKFDSTQSYANLVDAMANDQTVLEWAVRSFGEQFTRQMLCIQDGKEVRGLRDVSVSVAATGSGEGVRTLKGTEYLGPINQFLPTQTNHIWIDYTVPFKAHAGYVDMLGSYEERQKQRSENGRRKQRQKRERRDKQGGNQYGTVQKEKKKVNRPKAGAKSQKGGYKSEENTLFALRNRVALMNENMKEMRNEFKTIIAPLDRMARGLAAVMDKMQISEGDVPLAYEDDSTPRYRPRAIPGTLGEREEEYESNAVNSAVAKVALAEAGIKGDGKSLPPPTDPAQQLAGSKMREAGIVGDRTVGAQEVQDE